MKKQRQTRKVSSRRTKEEQSAHDKMVRRIANEYKKKGCKVKADIPSFPKPDPIGRSRRIPDIQALCGRRETIVEVETPKTVKRDVNQRATFRRYASQKKGRKFKTGIAK